MLRRPCEALTAALAVGVLLLAFAACSETTDGPEPDTSVSVSTPPVEPTGATVVPSVTPPEAGDTAAVPVTQPFGPGCPQLPEAGEGSLPDIASESVAEAVEDVPSLSRLAAAVRLAGVRDTLEDQTDLTVFAPNDTAFANISSATLRRLLADPTRADDILRYHIVSGRLTPDQLAGSHQTLSGQTVQVSGSGEDFTVNDRAAVVCGNIQTANATVYVIDQVLQPS